MGKLFRLDDYRRDEVERIAQNNFNDRLASIKATLNKLNRVMKKIKELEK